MMTRMLGLFACAKTLLTENVAINAIETANIVVNVDLVGFIDPNFGRNALCAILDLSLMHLRFSGAGRSRNANQDGWCRCWLRLCRACQRCSASNADRCKETNRRDARAFSR